VGDQGPAFHQEVLQKASQAGIEEIWLLGEAMTSAGRRLGIGRSFADLPALSAALQDFFDKAPPGQSCLNLQAQSPGLTAWVKGSRFMRLERLVDGLLSHYTKGLACSF
jgi:UDP-N-acetylmuramyl pentapeptide synthase